MKLNLCNFSKQSFKRSLPYVGVFDGSWAYYGPRVVQIDVTNRCNNNCLYCWARSPLLKERAASCEWRNYEIPFNVVKDLIDDLAFLGTERIHLSGGGEPFMHPRIMDIIEYIKNKNMKCEITTNFTLVDKKKSLQLIELGVDFVSVSLWAGNAKTYTDLHPNQSEDTFLNIVDTLKWIAEYKQKNKKNNFMIRICNVISKINYKEIENMIDLTEEVGANMYLFQVMDAILGYTDNLLLSEAQSQELIEDIKQLEGKMSRLQMQYNICVSELNEFVRRVSSKYASKGCYDQEERANKPCYAGWFFSRITAEGNVNFCLKTDEYPISNLFKARFKDIWNSKKYADFRNQMLDSQKKFDRPLRCGTTCDNRGENIGAYNRICSFSSNEKFFIKSLKIILKIKNKLRIKNIYEKI